MAAILIAAAAAASPSEIDGPGGEPATQPVAYVTADLGVWVVDPTGSGETFAFIPLPEPAAFLALSPDARTLLATAESSTIYVIDTTTRSVRATIVDEPDYAAGAFSPDGTLAYFVRLGLEEPASASSVSFVDLASNAVVASTPLDRDLYPRIAVRPDGRKGYVPRLLHPDASGRDFPFDITVVDLESGEVETTIPIPCGLAMYDVAFSPDGSRLYVPVLGSDICIDVAGAAAGTACRGDCDANGSISIDELVRGVNIALGLSALDTCMSLAGGDGSVEIADLIAAVSAALNGCAAPSPGDFAAVIDTSAQELITVIDLGRASAPGLAGDAGRTAGVAVQRTDGLGIELSPDGRLAFVAGCRDGVCIVDLERNEVVDTIALPNDVALPEGGTGSALPLGIAVTPDGRRGFVTILVSGPAPEFLARDELALLAVLDLDRRELVGTTELPGAADVVVGPLPIACPIDFSDDNTQIGTPDCLYLGIFGAECPELSLQTTWRSDGQTVTILFRDLDDVFCNATVTSASTADLTACSIDGEVVDVGGFVGLGFGNSSLVIEPTEVPFLVDECPVDFYLGALTDVVTPGALARARTP